MTAIFFAMAARIILALVRYALVLLALLFSSSLFGATADLAVTIVAPKTVDAQLGFVFTVRIINNGPDSAAHVQVKTGGAFVQGIQCYAAPEMNLGIHQEGSVACFTSPVQQTGIATVAATVTSDATDPNPGNNSASADVKSILGPNLGTGVFAFPFVVDPALPFELDAQYWNTSTLPATNVLMTIDLPEGAAVQTLPDFCSQPGSRIVCSLGTVPGGSSSLNPTVVRFGLIAPDRREGVTLSSHIAIAGNEAEGMVENNEYTSRFRLYRTFVVENTTDSGAGSLRSAMESANASCTDPFPCKVAFRVPTTDVATFKLESPLPHITGLSVDIDGTTETRMFGDTNPSGPEIFIDGSHLREGNGLVIATACNADILGLAIGNFPESGILVAPADRACSNLSIYPARQISGNYIGIVPSGSKAAPDERGIVVQGDYNILNNMISSNRRSGVFVQRGFHTAIGNNVIGLDAKHRADLGNGASGIYVSGTSVDTDISGNYIAFNHDFGVAIDRNANGTDVHPNSIFANWQMGIDNGLDGPTSAPVITAASYDPASDTTQIDVAYRDSSTFAPTLQFYASDAPHRSGYGDGQYYLGIANPRRGPPTLEQQFHFAAKGDWRGKWVSATITQNIFYGFGVAGPLHPLGEGADTHSSTSEFSRAVEVH